MAELLVIRHGQASFGADNYDVLSDLGHRQAAALGVVLRDIGWAPDRLVTGTLERQKDTLSSMGFTQAPEEHAGFNEYDFHDLLSAKFNGEVPELVVGDRKTHFRTLRETILDWQQDKIEGVAETWTDFSTRVEAARKFAIETEAKRVLVVSSGGPIGQLTATSLQAPTAQMMELNLQVKNTSMTRFIFSKRSFFLHELNATPHFMTQGGADLISYS